MLLNSNDIFSQIGFVVSNKQTSRESVHIYTVYLQIELSQGKNQLLSIRNYDDPYEVAVEFCRKNRLNQLAVQIVENKIVEAKRREENRLPEESRGRERERENTSFIRSSLSSNKPKHTSKSLNKDAYIPSKPSKPNKSIQNQNKEGKILTKNQLSSASPSKKVPINKPKQAQKSIPKQQSKKMVKDTNKSLSNIKQQKPQPKKANRQLGNHLYARAMVKMKMKQSEREKKIKQRIQEQSRELTFQPKINHVSAKIVEFRKEAGEETDKDRQKQNKKTSSNQLNLQKQIEQIKQCTFKPQINRVSELIAQNRNVYKDEFDHFTLLYKQAEEKKQKMEAKSNQSGSLLFQPKINTRSSEAIMETFQQRLERSIIKKKEIKQGLVSDSGCSFQPKIGRAPKISKSGVASNSSNQWWNQLYNERSRKVPATVLDSEQSRPSFSPQISTNSLIYFENLVEKRIVEVFKALDTDEDGFISPQAITVQNLSKGQLIFLKPLFEQIDDLQAHLDFTQFKKALTLLLNESDVHSRGQFLCQKPQRQQRTSFTPSINKKSRQLAQTRVHQGVQVFQKLYQKGIKDLQRKQYCNQRIRQQQQQQQLQQCSFKPLLNNTSKYYIDKVLGKKISKLQMQQQDN